GRRVSTIWFGGGTPSYLSAEQIAGILDETRRAFVVHANAEIRAEVNPTSVHAAKFAAMRAAGFNRLSIGVQSFDDRLLKAIDRDHTAAEAAEAVRMARQAGFGNLSIDLMFALPGQIAADWDSTLDHALE